MKEREIPVRRVPLTFETALERFSPKDQEKIKLAREFAEIAHKGQKRESGKKYITHPIESALILMDECGLWDADLVCAILLHDVPEDKPDFFADPKDKDYPDWIEETRTNIASYFGERVAGIVVDLTIPKVDRSQIKTKKEAKEISLDNLSLASSDAILVKMTERLHNLRTLKFRVEKKQKKVKKETIRDYFPIFELARSTYPKETEILMKAMQEAIKDVEDNLRASRRKRAKHKKKH